MLTRLLAAPARLRRRRGRRRPPAVAVLLLGVLAAGMLASAAAASADPSGGESIAVSVPYSGTIACVDLNGTAVTADTTLHHGDRLFCTVNGLVPGSRATARFTSLSASSRTATAASDGMAALDLTVSAALGLGERRVNFTSGAGLLGSVTFAVAAGASTIEATGDTAGTGTDGAGGGNGAGTDADSSRSTASTGVAALQMTLVAAALLGGGALLTLLGRRRRAGRFAA